MELIILSELCKNSKYMKRVLPHIKEEYFDAPEDKLLFKAIKWFVYKYRKKPTLTALATIVEKKRDIPEGVFNNIVERLGELQSFDEDNDTEWLVDSTEEFCQGKAFENAVIASGEIIESGGNRYKAKDLITEALKVNFNRHLGIDFFDEKMIRERHEQYNKRNEKFVTHITKLNEITGGGLESKCLQVFMGGTHVGKCVCGESKITIRNKITGLVEEISMKDFHNLLKYQN